jgi:phosphoglycolate phosphatase
VYDHFQTSRDDILFIGDSLHDAKIALRSNIDFLGREGTFTETDFKKISPQVKTIKNLNELKGMLCR